MDKLKFEITREMKQLIVRNIASTLLYLAKMTMIKTHVYKTFTKDLYDRW